MKKKWKIGVVSMLLATTLATQSLPMNILSALAESIEEALSSEKEVLQVFKGNNMIDAGNIGSGYILQENEENRTETTKEYLMSDDTIMVEQFVEPIHYLENGEYKEIDNAIVEDKELGVYKNTANSFKVQFKDESTALTKMVEIEENGYGFELSYETQELTRSSKIEIANTSGKEKVDYLGKKYSRPQEGKVSVGKINYGALNNNAGITYEIKNNTLSKNIEITKTKSEYEYTFKLSSSNLTFTQKEDGSIEAKDEKGVVRFELSLGYMVDAKGNYSEGVSYELEGDELKLKADSAWINTATLPVTIKPEIKSVKNKKVSFKNVYENGKVTENGEKLYVGKKNGAEKSDGFLSFKLPKVAPYYQLLGATVEFAYETQATGLSKAKNLSYDVYLANANGLSSVSYSEKPEKIKSLNGIESKSALATQTETYVSEIIDTNKLEGNALTIGIETQDATSSGGYISVLAASESTTRALYWYERVLGIEDDYSMESVSIDGATAHVNNGTGQLTAVFDLASVNTLSEIPFELSLVYNDYYDDLIRYIGATKTCGNNFKLNFQQYMVGRGNVYEMIDADGSITTFYNVPKVGVYYSPEKDLYYNRLTARVYDLQGNEMLFNKGRLIKIHSLNNQEEYITVTHENSTSDRIKKLDYYANNVLKYSISLNYENNRLTTVTTNADATMPLTKRLEYDDDGNLVGIINQTNGGNVKTMDLGYCRATSLDPVGTLNYVFDNQKNGIEFERLAGDPIDNLRKLNAESTRSLSLRQESCITYHYYGIYTQMDYFEHNFLTKSKFVSFNNSKKVISEWVEDSMGRATVQVTTNWQDRMSSQTEYVQQTGSYYHEPDWSARQISANGGVITPRINKESLGIEQDVTNANGEKLYAYAVVFKIVTGDSDNVLLSGINLSVKIGNEATQSINLDYGGSTYVVIPCGFYGNNTTVRITNNGAEEVLIQYLDYTLMNLAKESYAYDSSISAHTLSSTTTSLQTGAYVKTTYDAKHRISTQETCSIMADLVVKNTTYSYNDEADADNKEKGKLKDVKTTALEEVVEGGVTKLKNVEIETTEYVYVDLLGSYTEAVATTKRGISTHSMYSISQDGSDYVVTQTDGNNISTTGYYKPMSGDIRLWKVEYGTTIEEYTYNALGQITTTEVYDSLDGTLKLSQTDNYDINGMYVGTSFGGVEYTHTYDDSGYVTSIGTRATGATGNSTPLIEYLHRGDEYDSFFSSKLDRKSYANGNVEEYTYREGEYPATYDYQTRVDCRTTTGGTITSTYYYHYDAHGRMINQIAQRNSYTQVTYDYGDLNNRERKTLSINGLEYYFQYTNNYNKLNNQLENTQISSVVGSATENIRTLSYDYTAGKVSEINNGSYKVGYAYDAMDRLTNRRTTNCISSRTVQNENYVYQTYGAYTTNLLTLIEDQTIHGNDRTATYDENGYVTSVSYNEKTYEYEYDGAGRLISERKNGALQGEYSYDSANNIQKAGLTYTNGKLTAVNGSQIVYDALGNPTTYKGNTFTWQQGRKLVSGRMNGKSFTYSYDGNGMRYEKTVSGTKTHYYYNGTQLLMESKNRQRTWYIYGVTGIEGMIVNLGYREDAYYFDKNTLGDVVAIRDGSGNVLATYEYDAWGNAIVRDENGSRNTSATFIGNVNPIRYRGYYYDTETGFYYLQTRYYDPTICRFINADNYELFAQLSGVVGELNMYSYCNNNPIMYTDESGEFVLSLVAGLAISFAIGFGVSVVSQGAQYGWGNINYLQAGVDGMFSLASTALAYTGIGIVASMGLGAAMGAMQYAIDSAVFRDDFTWEGLGKATGLGLLGGLISGAGARNLDNIAKNLTGRASQGVKALITATQRFGVNSSQIGLVRNLYQGAINTATQAIVEKAFTQAILKINAMTIVNPMVNMWLSYIVC